MPDHKKLHLSVPTTHDPFDTTFNYSTCYLFYEFPIPYRVKNRFCTGQHKESRFFTTFNSEVRMYKLKDTKRKMSGKSANEYWEEFLML